MNIAELPDNTLIGELALFAIGVWGSRARSAMKRYFPGKKLRSPTDRDFALAAGQKLGDCYDKS